jgi:GTP1/Obg family GTP-binding protein
MIKAAQRRMTARVGEDKMKPQLSVNEVFQRLTKFEQEFESLMKTAEVQNPAACDSIARDIRLYLHQARVLVLCANVNDAMVFLNTAEEQMQQLQTLLVQSSPKR